MTSSPRVNPPARAAGEILANPRRAAYLRRREATPWFFLAPALIIIGGFVIWPMIRALYTSFTDSAIIGTAHWIGLDNYAKLLSDPAFGNALGNSFVYAIGTTPASVLLALGLALLLNRALPARTFFRAIIFFPFVVSFAIIAIAWSFMLDPQVGIITGVLNSLGINTGNGIRDPEWAMPLVILVGIWRNLGFYMVLFLGGLQSIPRELYEAAEIDGAGPWRRTRSITLPLLSNTTMFVVIIASIFAFQAFDHIYVMTNGGPFFKTEQLVMLIYRTGFANFQMGYASAMSWVLVLIVLILSLLQMWYFSRKTVKY